MRVVVMVVPVAVFMFVMVMVLMAVFMFMMVFMFMFVIVFHIVYFFVCSVYPFLFSCSLRFAKSINLINYFRFAGFVVLFVAFALPPKAE